MSVILIVTSELHPKIEVCVCACAHTHIYACSFTIMEYVKAEVKNLSTYMLDSSFSFVTGVTVVIKLCFSQKVSVMALLSLQ